MTVYRQEPQYIDYEGISNMVISAMQEGGASVSETLQREFPEKAKEMSEVIVVGAQAINNGQKAALNIQKGIDGLSYRTFETRKYENVHLKEERVNKVENSVDEEKSIHEQVEAFDHEKPTSRATIVKDRGGYGGFASKLADEPKPVIKQILQEQKALSDNHEHTLNCAKGVVKGMKVYEEHVLKQERMMGQEASIQKDMGLSKEKDGGLYH